MYVVGGGYDNVERYDFEARKWFKVAVLPMCGRRPYVAVVNDQLFVMGGWDNYDEDYVQDVYVYDNFNDNWERKADMPDVCRKGACAVLNSDIFIVGGTSSGKNMRYSTAMDQWTIIPNPPRTIICGGAF
jgi:N-acetylneuraminic acid mutarotase